MQIQAWQIIVLALFLVITAYDGMNTQFLIFGSTVLRGFVTGIIFGDSVLGLQIGATLQLMSLGVGAYGGASVPDYGMGAVIGTAIAITTGQNMEAGLAIGLPVSLLAIQLDVLVRMGTSFFLNQAKKCVESLSLKKMYMWIISGYSLFILKAVIPPVLALTLGKDAIEAVLAAFPVWLMTGFKLAGGVLPAVGIAILLRYMNTKNNIAYLLIGFGLVAYLSVPMMGVAIFASALAVIYYKSQVNLLSHTSAMSYVKTNTSNGLGDDEDEL